MLLPPTDSLYKFMAIAGVWIAIGFPLALLYFKKFTLDRVAAVKISNEKVRSFNESVQEKLADACIKGESHFNSVQTDIEQKYDEMRALTDKTEINLQLVEQYTNSIKSYRKALIAVYVMGVTMMGGGFVGWAVKIQIPQDEILEIELRKSRISLREIERKSNVSQPPIDENQNP